MPAIRKCVIRICYILIIAKHKMKPNCSGYLTAAPLPSGYNLYKG